MFIELSEGGRLAAESLGKSWQGEQSTAISS